MWRCYAASVASGARLHRYTYREQLALTAVACTLTVDDVFRDELAAGP